MFYFYYVIFSSGFQCFNTVYGRVLTHPIPGSHVWFSSLVISGFLWHATSQGNKVFIAETFFLLKWSFLFWIITNILLLKRCCKSLHSETIKEVTFFMKYDSVSNLTLWSVNRALDIIVNYEFPSNFFKKKKRYLYLCLIPMEGCRKCLHIQQQIKKLLISFVMGYIISGNNFNSVWSYQSKEWRNCSPVRKEWRMGNCRDDDGTW